MCSMKKEVEQMKISTCSVLVSIFSPLNDLSFVIHLKTRDRRKKRSELIAETSR